MQSSRRKTLVVVIWGLVQGILRAAWAEEKDISDDAVLKDLLVANGFDRTLTMSGMLSGLKHTRKTLRTQCHMGFRRAILCARERRKILGSGPTWGS